MRTLISFCFWAFCLLLFVSMSPSKLFCYLFCLTRFFTGCCLCLLGCSLHLRLPVKPLTLTHLRRHTPAHLPHTHTHSHTTNTFDKAMAEHFLFSDPLSLSWFFSFLRPSSFLLLRSSPSCCFFCNDFHANHSN